jgi:cytochrome c-type biogenesis protein CcmF
MPWLTGTAFLHSVMVQERRGMLKVWNVSLIVATFSLALLGTFLVRSGVLESIHAFGVSKVGGPLLGLIAVVVLGSAALIVSRLDDLRSERRIDSLLSRESIFLVNNLLLVGLCAVVFWGTFFPLISEAITGTRSSLAGPWFARYVPPIAILLVLFSGIGPLVAWRQVSVGKAWRVFRWPLLAAAATVVALLAFSDAGDEPLSLALLLGVRARGGDRGVRQGGLGAPLAVGSIRARRPGRDRDPQPAPLRRLHRARRDRAAVHRGGRIVRLSDEPGPALAAGGERDRGGLRAALRGADRRDRRR